LARECEALLTKLERALKRSIHLLDERVGSSFVSDRRGGSMTRQDGDGVAEGKELFLYPTKQKLAIPTR
jgi:hypothetical protein